MKILDRILDAIRNILNPDMGKEEVAARLEQLAADSPEKLNWRTSIVDLLKLLELDSSRSAREELALELGYDGSREDSAAMNTWLHRHVLEEVAKHHIKLPEACAA